MAINLFTNAFPSQYVMFPVSNVEPSIYVAPCSRCVSRKKKDSAKDGIERRQTGINEQQLLNYSSKFS